ncbi:MAG: Rpp14/Pop5 family protein [Candidatus Woesearchaeota archaeon]
MRVTKIKSLLPSLKENKRYVLYEIMSKNKIMGNHQKILEEEIRGFIGDLGIARAGLKFIKSKENKGILQVNHKSVHEVKTALALIDRFNVRTVKVSGMINKLLGAM